MFVFDAHCDTLSTGRSLWQNSGHVDIARLRARGPGMQVMAAYGSDQLLQLDRLGAVSGSANCALLPAVEGGDTVENLDGLAPFLSRKPVFFGLTWNHDNRLAGGCKGVGGGLTSFGRDAIRTLENEGILIDLSHASEQTFWDVMEYTRATPVVSHACCAALCSHRGNLNDAQLKELAEAGGVLGITFYPPFLTGRDEASLADVVRHIEHAVSIMGPEHVGIGSDFDGCELLPEGIAGTQDIPSLINALPFDEHTRGLIAGGNFLRILPSRQEERRANEVRPYA